MTAKIRRVLNAEAEHKYFPLTSSGTVDVSTVPTLFSICDVTQGSTDITRTGDSLWMLNVTFTFSITAASTDVTNIIRLIIFQWYPQVAPTGSQILLTETGSGSTDNIYSPGNHDTRSNYKILYDKNHEMTYGTFNTASKVYKVTLTKGFRRKIQYISGGTSGSNKLYALFVSDSSAVSHPKRSNYSILNFIDM